MLFLRPLLENQEAADSNLNLVRLKDEGVTWSSYVDVVEVAARRPVVDMIALNASGNNCLAGLYKDLAETAVD